MSQKDGHLFYWHVFPICERLIPEQANLNLNLIPTFLMSFLNKLALAATIPQLSRTVGVVPVNEYFHEMGSTKLGWRALRRQLLFLASGQSNYKIATLKNVGKRGLWLYYGEGQIGDALMDLAPRSLLKENGYQIDLLADKSISQLFENDLWFESVYNDASLMPMESYDFAITLSNKRRSIQKKRRYFKKLPWVSIHENFSGPDFDRAGYATQRISDLLQVDLMPTEFLIHSKQKLRSRLTTNIFDGQISQLNDVIAICIGGVDRLRTYKAWATVISELINVGQHKFLLVGSMNGDEYALKIVQTFDGKASINNCVGRCTLQQSHDLLANAQIVACADGGLMHLTATTATPMVALFSSSIHPEWRLSSRSKTTCLCSSTNDVNNIPASHIIEAICDLKNKLTQTMY